MLCQTRLDSGLVFNPGGEALSSLNLQFAHWHTIGEAHRFLDSAITKARFRDSQSRVVLSISAASGVGKTRVVSSLVRWRSGVNLPILVRVASEASETIAPTLTPPFEALLEAVRVLERTSTGASRLRVATAGKGLINLLFACYFRWVELVVQFTKSMVDGEVALESLEVSDLDPVRTLLEKVRSDRATALPELVRDMIARCTWGLLVNQFVSRTFQRMLATVDSLAAFEDGRAMTGLFSARAQRLHSVLASCNVRVSLSIAIDEFAALKRGKTHVFARVENDGEEVEAAESEIRNSLLLGVSRVLDDIRSGDDDVCSPIILGTNFSAGPELLQETSCFRRKPIGYFHNFPLLSVDQLIDYLNEMVPEGGERLRADDALLREALTFFSGRPLLFFRDAFSDIVHRVASSARAGADSFSMIVIEESLIHSSTSLKHFCRGVVDSALEKEILVGNEASRNLIPAIFWDAVCGVPMWRGADWLALHRVPDDTRKVINNNVTSWAIRIGLVPLPLASVHFNDVGSVLAFEEPAILVAAEERVLSGVRWKDIDLAVVGALGNVGLDSNPANLGIVLESLVALHLARTVSMRRADAGGRVVGCPLHALLAVFLPTLAEEERGAVERLSRFVSYASRLLRVHRMQEMLAKVETGKLVAAERDLPLLFWDVERRRPRVDTVFFDWSHAHGGPDILFWVEDTNPGERVDSRGEAAEIGITAAPAPPSADIPSMSALGDSPFVTLSCPSGGRAERGRAAAEGEAAGGGGRAGAGEEAAGEEAAGGGGRRSGGHPPGSSRSTVTRTRTSILDVRTPVHGRSLLDRASFHEHKFLFATESDEAGLHRARCWRLVCIQLKNKEDLKVKEAVASLELPLLFAPKLAKSARTATTTPAWMNFQRASALYGLDAAFETPLRFVLSRADTTACPELAEWSQRSWAHGSSPLTFLHASNEALSRIAGSEMFARGGDVAIKDIPPPENRHAALAEFRMFRDVARTLEAERGGE